PILGSDIRQEAVMFAQRNARAAGVGHLLEFARRGLRDFQPPPGPPGLLICNPPYGERIGEAKELPALYKLMGDTFKQRCAGWTAYVFCADDTPADQIGLKPSSQVPLYNGKIP